MATQARRFERKAAANAFVTQVSSDMVIGTYVDKKSSAVPFGIVAGEWIAAKAC